MAKAKTFIKLLLSIMLLHSSQSHAIDLLKYTKNLEKNTSDESAKGTIIGILGTCGNQYNLNDSCVLSGLERVSTEEGNTLAKSILEDYQNALNETDPECQNENFKTVKRTIGHCILLMNYYSIEYNDNEGALNQYETCLQGGMTGLAYQGILPAAYLLGQVFQDKGVETTADTWIKFFNSKKGTEEYDLVLKCFS